MGAITFEMAKNAVIAGGVSIVGDIDEGWEMKSLLEYSLTLDAKKP